MAWACSESQASRYPRIDRRAQWEEKRERVSRVELHVSIRHDGGLLCQPAAQSDVAYACRGPVQSIECGRRVCGSARLSNDPLADQYDFQHRWTSSPLVSGYLYLSPKVFGHLAQTEELVRNCTARQRLTSNEGPARVLFARLVALRINMSAFLSGLNYQLDRLPSSPRANRPCFAR